MDASEELGNCRCCFVEADGGHKRLQQLDNFGGIQNTYSEIVNNTFGITLSSLKYNHICDLCSERLRDANTFKRLVLNTERRFLQLVGSDGKPSVPEATSFVKVEDADRDEEDVRWDDDADDHQDGDELAEPISPKVEILKKETEKNQPPSVAKPAKAPTVSSSGGQFDPTKRKVMMNQFVKLLARKGPKKPRDRRTAARQIQTNQPGQPAKSMAGKLALNEGSSTGGCSVKISASTAQMLMKRTLRVGQRSAAESSRKVESKRIVVFPTEKRAQREIAKRNVAALLEHTTMCPFTNHWSVFGCFYCRKEFADFEQVRTHTNETHTDIRRAVYAVPYRREWVVNVDITSLKCRLCEKDCADVDTIKEHLVDKHKVNVNPKYKNDVLAFKLKEDRYECHICSESFHVFRNLSQHMNNHFKNYVCQVCGKGFTSECRYASHEGTHATGEYPCSKCDRVFDSMNARSIHTATHRGPKYRCPHCSARFEKFIERTVHISEVHNITRTFRCPHPQCDKAYIHKPSMKAHARTHMPLEKKVVCSECGMRFVNNYSLYRHAVTHKGERPYQCTVCGKKCGRKYKLAEHMKEHNET